MIVTWKMMRPRSVKASDRIKAEFMEMLEQQFPIANQLPIRLRYPSQFADHLNIHVNHLNRAIKETISKTTTQVISERILQEAKLLLRQSNISVTDIAFSLGFAEATHFANFFRKHAKVAPSEYRSIFKNQLHSL